MTPAEWACFIDGYRLRQEDLWQHTRAIYALLYNINVESHHRKTAMELIPLPGDRAENESESGETERAKYLTEEERVELRRKYNIGGC